MSDSALNQMVAGKLGLEAAYGPKMIGMQVTIVENGFTVQQQFEYQQGKFWVFTDPTAVAAKVEELLKSNGQV